jgi:hypothetical protein
MSTTTSLAEHWSELATVGLLGLARRSLPGIPAGVLGDLERARANHDAAMTALDRLGALTAVRRAGWRPGPTAVALVPCPPDDRVGCPTALIELYYRIAEHRPALLGQWLDGVGERRWSVPGDVAVDLLSRTGSDPDLRAAAAAVIGPMVGWLVELFPDEVSPRRAASRPEVAALGPPVVELSTGDITWAAEHLVEGFTQGLLGNRHRSSLERLLLSVDIDRLAALDGALARVADQPATVGLVLSLIDLVELRVDLNKELNREWT